MVSFGQQQELARHSTSAKTRSCYSLLFVCWIFDGLYQTNSPSVLVEELVVAEFGSERILWVDDKHSFTKFHPALKNKT